MKHPLRELASHIISGNPNIPLWLEEIDKLSGSGHIASTIGKFIRETNYHLELSFETMMHFIMELASSHYPHETEENIVFWGIHKSAQELMLADRIDYRKKNGKDSSEELDAENLKRHTADLKARWERECERCALGGQPKL